jgi:serine protease DegQ
VQRGRIGILVQTLTPELADAMELPNEAGALISQVASDSPAGREGLERGDVVLEMDGRPIRSSADLRSRIGTRTIGDEIELLVLHAGETRRVRLTIVAR